MNREEKAQVIERLAAKLRVGSAVLVDYQGMDVARTTDLRRRIDQGRLRHIVHPFSVGVAGVLDSKPGLLCKRPCRRHHVRTFSRSLPRADQVLRLLAFV